MRGRGQLAHVTLTDEHRFAVAEKVQVTACYFENCRMGMAEIMRQATTHLYDAATRVGHTAARLKDLLHNNLSVLAREWGAPSGAPSVQGS